MTILVNMALYLGYVFVGLAGVLALGRVIVRAGDLWRFVQARHQRGSSPMTDIAEEP